MHAANVVSAVWQTKCEIRSRIGSCGTVYSKLKPFLLKVRSGGDGEEDGRAVQGVRRQGEREALRRRVVRRLQGVLQEEHQEARRHVSTDVE